MAELMWKGKALYIVTTEHIQVIQPLHFYVDIFLHMCKSSNTISQAFAEVLCTHIYGFALNKVQCLFSNANILIIKGCCMLLLFLYRYIKETTVTDFFFNWEK